MPIENNAFKQFNIPQPYTMTEPVRKETSIPPEKKTTEGFHITRKEKQQLAVAGLVTLSGIMMFAGRGFIAKRLFKPPESQFKPLENLVDDTIEQATEVVNNKFGNIITTGFYNANTEEMLNFQKMATGKALKNLSDIITFKYEHLKEIDDKTYLTHIERYIETLLHKDSLEYKDPDIIIQTSNAYYNTNQKDKAFGLLEKMLDNIKDTWAQEYFLNQKIILLGKEKNYQTILDIVKNNKFNPNDSTLFVIMQSLKEINCPADSCVYFENNFNRNINDKMKSFEYYLELTIQSGRKQELYKLITNYRNVSDKQLFKILTQNRDKLELDEKTNQIIDLYNELYKNEARYEWRTALPEQVDKTIEIYKQARVLNIINEEQYTDIMTKLTSYKATPSEENFSKFILPLKINIQDEENPFYKKLLEYLT